MSKDKKEVERQEKKYLVLKKFTGSKVHNPSDVISLDENSEQTKYLLTNKFIK